MGTVVFLLLLTAFLVALGRSTMPVVRHSPWSRTTPREVGRLALRGARALADLGGPRGGGQGLA
ncbi:hypothetical protein [Actinotalea sp. K2]|uniref:hypothetical protein n=1 Tax=Actinotalea sp. K2 TaxID=2939438 RepID=UPI0020178BC8|nr:hypothetical protein [Actinotalea sp. K2]MCL3860826.1 hypothetical protein [Actinotalea sp. K2]